MLGSSDVLLRSGGVLFGVSVAFCGMLPLLLVEEGVREGHSGGIGPVLSRGFAAMMRRRRRTSELLHTSSEGSKIDVEMLVDQTETLRQTHPCEPAVARDARGGGRGPFLPRLQQQYRRKVETCAASRS